MTAKRPPDHPSSRAVHNSQLHNFFSQFIKKGISGKTVEIGKPTLKKYDYWSFSHQKTKKKWGRSEHNTAIGTEEGGLLAVNWRVIGSLNWMVILATVKRAYLLCLPENR